MKYKVYLSMLLAASLSCGNTLSVFAQATESTTNVNLTVVNSDTEPKPVAVEVPSELNLKMDETGKIDVVNDMYIKNLSDETNIEVSELSVEGVNGWTVSDYSDDLSAEVDGTKKLSMEFNGDGTTSTGKVNLSEDNWTIEKSSKLPLNVNVKMPKQTEQSKTNIAVINYTFDTTTNTPSIPPEDDESVLSNNWDNSTKMLPGSSKEVKFNWDSTKADTHIVSIESSNPEIADISEASTFASLDYNGEKSYTVEGVGRGTTTITATLDTGETSSFTVNVYELAGGDSGENIEIEVPGTDLQPGDNTSDSDITIEIPVTNPDGSDDVIVVKPEIPSTDLEEGRNEIEVTVDVNGVTVNIIIVINITSPAEENPSNGLQQSVEEAQAMGFTFSAYEDGLQIDSFENKMFKSEINVPEQIGEFKVLKIGDNAFKGESNLKKVTLPNTITDIGDYAFSGCTNLQKLDLHEGIVSIGTKAFSGLQNIDSLYIPSTFDPDLTDYAFGSLGSEDKGILIKVNGPISDAIFKDSYISVEFMDKAEVRDSAFSLCTITSDLYLDSKLNISRTKDSVIFGGTKFISSVLYIDNDIVEQDYSGELNSPFSSIGDRYSNAEKVKIVIGDSVSCIGNFVFAKKYCNIKEVVLSNSVTKICDDAFYDNDNLESIVIPDSVLEIGNSAFYWCKNLQDVVIPDSVKTIGSGAFQLVPHITYTGTASGSPWGAVAIN